MYIYNAGTGYIADTLNDCQLAVPGTHGFVRLIKKAIAALVLRLKYLLYRWDFTMNSHYVKYFVKAAHYVHESSMYLFRLST